MKTGLKEEDKKLFLSLLPGKGRKLFSSMGINYAKN
jgi:hypothetical protein